MTIAFRASIAVVLASFVPFFTQAWQKPPATGNRLITLDVVVADHSETPVLGLQQQDFALLDNKQPQKIVSFSGPRVAAAPDALAEVILLMDEVNTSYSSVGRETIQIEKFLSQNGGRLPLPVSLIFFTDNGLSIGNSPATQAPSQMDKL